MHIDIDHRAVRRVARNVGDVHFLEKAEIADSHPRTPQLRGVEGVALRKLHLAADHLVERSYISRNIDPVDVDPWTFLNVVGNADRLRLAIAVDPRPHVDECITQAAELIGDRVDRLLDLVGVVPVALDRVDLLAQRFGIEVAQARHDVDLAEAVALALIDREGDEEPLAVGGQFGDDRHHAKIGVAVREIEPPQEITVERQPIGIVSVVGREDAVPAAFLGLDHLAQAPVAELGVGHESDPLNAGDLTFADLEHEIDAILRQRNHFRFDGRGEATAAAIKIEDAFHVGLNLGPRIDDARPQLHLVGEYFVADSSIPLEGDPVDDRVFDHADNQCIAIALQGHVGEKAGTEERLQRAVEELGIGAIARPDQEIRSHRIGIDALRTLDSNLLDCRSRRYLRHRRRDGRGRQQDRAQKPKSPDAWTNAWLHVTPPVPPADCSAPAKVQLTKSTRNWTTRSCTRSFQVANSIRLNTKMIPIRKPYSCVRSPSGRPRTASKA